MIHAHQVCVRFPIELEHLEKLGDPVALQPLLDAIEAQAGTSKVQMAVEDHWHRLTGPLTGLSTAYHYKTPLDAACSVLAAAVWCAG